VLLVSGGAWGVTSAFALWGSKFLGLFASHPPMADRVRRLEEMARRSL
jgi:Zn-dependent protease with chaperone function